MLLIAGSAAGRQMQALPDESDTAVCGCGKAHMLLAREQAGLPIGDIMPGPGYESRESADATDVISCNLDIEINPTNSNIAGTCTMVVRSRIEGLTQFTIVLRTNYTVSGATINGSTPVTVPGPVANGYSRSINLDRAYHLGEQFTLRIPYSGAAVSRGFGSIEFQSQPNSTNPIVASLSEAYFAATWWPCKDGEVFSPGDNSDKFTMRMSITAPDTLTSVSNGPRESVTALSGARKKYTYATTYPISSYLVMFASSVYNSWSSTYTYTPDGGGPARTMPCNFYIYPADDTPAHRAAWGLCTTMMDAYRPYYGLYPFINEQYGIYEFPFGGGMEHQTMTGQGTFDEGVTAHELGHQWWGDNVTCKTWNHIWLNEGFATYTEAIWAERKPGSSGAPALLAAMAGKRPGNNAGDSVYVYDVTNMNRIFSGDYTYRKGGWVLHQLRHMLGDTVFFNGLKEYRARMQGSAATTEDFAAAMGSVAGKDLSNYFQQWVYGVGAPDYAYGYQSVVIGGRNYLRLSLRQTQASTWPGVGTPGDAFVMPVDIRVDSASGSSTFTVRNTARSQNFVIPIAAPATGIVVDESNWILSYNKVAEAYLNGSAKVVAASPAPGESVAAANAPNRIQLTFSEPVTIPSGSIELTGPGNTVIPVTQTGNPSIQTVSGTISSTLPPGTYRVRIPVSVTTVSSGQVLDGEVIGAALPSGDGSQGGEFSYTFTVVAPSCPADFNQDGGVDGADVESFFVAWQNGLPEADVNEDGGIDGSDVATFFLAWQAGGC